MVTRASSSVTHVKALPRICNARRSLDFPQGVMVVLLLTIDSKQQLALVEIIQSRHSFQQSNQVIAQSMVAPGAVPSARLSRKNSHMPPSGLRISSFSGAMSTVMGTSMSSTNSLTLVLTLVAIAPSSAFLMPFWLLCGRPLLQKLKSNTPKTCAREYDEAVPIFEPFLQLWLDRLAKRDPVLVPFTLHVCSDLVVHDQRPILWHRCIWRHGQHICSAYKIEASNLGAGRDLAKNPGVLVWLTLTNMCCMRMHTCR